MITIIIIIIAPPLRYLSHLMRKPTGICRFTLTIPVSRITEWMHGFADHKGKKVWAVYVAEEAIPRL